MEKVKGMCRYFSKGELLLWVLSAVTITISFLLFDRTNYLTLIASLIGVTSLIFNAKGNPFGQLLMVIFSVLYGIISYSFSYYGEMITYMRMTGHMAFFTLVSWLRNPYKGKKSQVKVNSINRKEAWFTVLLTAVVTVVFYFILKYFETANLFFSTVSVTTSFAAVYLTFRRSPYFALIYALNDIVLIILWVYASLSDITYLSVVICFLMFLVNDIYGFVSWLKMEKKQNSTAPVA